MREIDSVLVDDGSAWRANVDSLGQEIPFGFTAGSTIRSPRTNRHGVLAIVAACTAVVIVAICIRLATHQTTGRIHSSGGSVAPSTQAVSELTDSKWQLVSLTRYGAHLKPKPLASLTLSVTPYSASRGQHGKSWALLFGCASAVAHITPEDIKFTQFWAGATQGASQCGDFPSTAVGRDQSNFLYQSLLQGSVRWHVANGHILKVVHTGVGSITLTRAK